MIGLDEVGRGCFAGPLVVAAVRLNQSIPDLADSKELSRSKRVQLEPVIRRKADDISIAWVSAPEIDKHGLGPALYMCFRKAFSRISKDASDTVVIDGVVDYLANELHTDVTTIPRADSSVPAVMAASVIAKQARDRFMAQQAISYPQYGFESHVGYGTSAHKHAIEQHGVTPLHRLSLKPLQRYDTPDKRQAGRVSS